TRLRVRLALDHQEGAERADREAAVRPAFPYGAEIAFEAVAAELVEHDDVGALAVVGAADQRDLALAGRDARERDLQRVDAGELLAHEGARGASDAVHDRHVAGEQV